MPIGVRHVRLEPATTYLFDSHVRTLLLTLCGTGLLCTTDPLYVHFSYS